MTTLNDIQRELLALELRAESEQGMSGIRLVVGQGWSVLISGFGAKSE